jgi:SAM-dependent methyltransferase
MTAGIKNEEKLTAYWREEARSFPRPSQEEELAKSRRIITSVKGMGVALAGTKILEIGCGSGLITIPLAREALQVTALDLSREMLDLLAEEMVKAETTNIELRCCSWQAVEPSLEEALQKSCDSVWAVRSTAITNPEDLTRMELCSKAWCVFAGADAIRRVPMMEGILAFHGIPSILSPSAAEVFEMIEKRGRTPMRDRIHLVWDRECPVEAVLRDITRHIELYGVAPQRAMIEDTVRTQCPDGVVQLSNAVDLGIVCWRVDQ